MYTSNKKGNQLDDIKVLANQFVVIVDPVSGRAYKALISDLQEVIVGGGDYVLRAGTETGKPVTGPIEYSDLIEQVLVETATLKFTITTNLSGTHEAVLKVLNKTTGDYSTLTISEAAIKLSSNDSLKNTAISAVKDRVVVFSSLSSSKGLSGLQDFTPNITDLDYVQKKFVTALTGLLSNLNTTDKSNLVNAINEGLVRGLSDVLITGNDGGMKQIKNIADPTEDQDAVTKKYLDGVISLLISTEIITEDGQNIKSEDNKILIQN